MANFQRYPAASSPQHGGRPLSGRTLGGIDSPLVLLTREVATQTILINTESGPGNRVNQIKESVKRGLDEGDCCDGRACECAGLTPTGPR